MATGASIKFGVDDSRNHETTYYRIDGHGRTAMKATSDKAAIEYVKTYDKKWGTRTLRVVKSEVTTIWRNA